ncbi:putative membrane protein [Mycobacterium kansasii 824]|nr:putative membrane protein [Mycobacterium kansasii 824]
MLTAVLAKVSVVAVEHFLIRTRTMAGAVGYCRILSSHGFGRRRRLTSLVNASAMLLVPAMMGFSTVLCLARAPSPLTLVAIHEYLGRARIFDRIWLLAAFGWIGWAGVQGGAPGCTVAAGAVALVLSGLHFWLTGSLRGMLAPLVGAILRAGPVTAVGEDGMLVSRRRTREDIPVLPVDWAARTLALVLLADIGLFVSVALVADPSSFGLAILVGGFWLSLGVIGIDLAQDVWPGTTSAARLAECSRYYVQVFEQWKNIGVLVGFGTVLIGAPIAWAIGRAGAPVLAFPLWTGACLVFAISFNKVLQRIGWNRSRVPLPVSVNEYSATHPLWAHSFTLIHLVMALALLAGLVALHPVHA